MKPRPISEAHVLKLIRDRTAVTEPELASYLRHGRWDVPESVIRQGLRKVLQALVDGELVAEDSGGSYSVTVWTDRLTRALSISLTELSAWDELSVVAHPIFGKPAAAKQEWSDVFVAMPFATELRPVYEDHIQKVCKKLSLSVARADDFYSTGSIISNVWAAIYFCNVLIADCTGRNPNVFYEIGIGHTIGRSTILVSQSIDDVPFDLRHLRCFIYELTPRGMRSFETDLTRALETEIAWSQP